jgi:hypothetical protein
LRHAELPCRERTSPSALREPSATLTMCRLKVREHRGAAPAIRARQRSPSPPPGRPNALPDEEPEAANRSEGDG